MIEKYQNEIAPIFYYGISTKTNEKDLKIPNLQLPDWKHPYWMSLYIKSFPRSFLWVVSIYIIFNIELKPKCMDKQETIKVNFMIRIQCHN